MTSVVAPARRLYISIPAVVSHFGSHQPLPPWDELARQLGAPSPQHVRVSRRVYGLLREKTKDWLRAHGATVDADAHPHGAFSPALAGSAVEVLA